MQVGQKWELQTEGKLSGSVMDLIWFWAETKCGHYRDGVLSQSNQGLVEGDESTAGPKVEQLRVSIGGVVAECELILQWNHRVTACNSICNKTDLGSLVLIAPPPTPHNTHDYSSRASWGIFFLGGGEGSTIIDEET